MPKKPPVGKRFEPGQSGNPLGAALHNPVKKKIKKLTLEQLDLILNKVLLANPKDLDSVAKENPSILKTWIASIAQTGIKKGDPSALLALLDRLIGKVTDKMKITSDIHSAPQLVITLPANGFESPEEKSKV